MRFRHRRRRQISNPESQIDNHRSTRLLIAGRVGGLLLFALILMAPAPAGMPVMAQRLAAVTILMAVFWVTQAIPIAATSLIPLVAFPLLGIQTAADVSRSYINEKIFLYLGGFIIALGIEKWRLHRRIALHVVAMIGTSPRRLVLGFMLATGFLSMWISNTASTLLMMPIGLAMLTSLRTLAADDGLDDDESGAIDRLGVALMLGIAYSASIGGVSTIVGTPTNNVFVGIWSTQFPQAPEISSGQWMTAFVPPCAVFLVITWLLLTWRLAGGSLEKLGQTSVIDDHIRELGRPRRSEWLMAIIFAATALLWITRTGLRLTANGPPLIPGWGPIVAEWLVAGGMDPDLAPTAIRDSTIAMAMCLLMFLLPGDPDEGGRSRPLMDWPTAVKLPWDIILLFGGGFAIAGAFGDTGLSRWLGEAIASDVRGWPPWLLVAGMCLLMTFLTEFTTNVATVNTIMPVLAGATVSLGIDPRFIMLPATVSTSFAFMLPIATPPNAIVFGSGTLKMSHMIRYGTVLNLIGVVIMTISAFVFVVPQWGIDLNVVPDWVTGSP